MTGENFRRLDRTNTLKEKLTALRNNLNKVYDEYCRKLEEGNCNESYYINKLESLNFKIENIEYLMKSVTN